MPQHQFAQFELLILISVRPTEILVNKSNNGKEFLPPQDVQNLIWPRCQCSPCFFYRAYVTCTVGLLFRMFVEVGRQGKTIGDLSFARAVTITAGIGSWALLSRSGRGYKDTCWELPKTWFTVGKWNLFICMKGTRFQPSLSTGFQRLFVYWRLEFVSRCLILDTGGVFQSILMSCCSRLGRCNLLWICLFTWFQSAKS